MPIFPTGRSLIDAGAVLLRSGLSYNMNYADLGSSGVGHFVFAAAQIVGKLGEVYAVDIRKKPLEYLDSQAKMQSLANVEVIVADIEAKKGIPLKSGSLDFISLVNVIPMLKKPGNTFEEAKRLLKKDGVLLIVDWNPNARFCMYSYHPMKLKEFEKLAAEHDFEVLDSFKAGPCHSALVLQKK